MNISILIGIAYLFITSNRCMNMDVIPNMTPIIWLGETPALSNGCLMRYASKVKPKLVGVYGINGTCIANGNHCEDYELMYNRDSISKVSRNELVNHIRKGVRVVREVVFRFGASKVLVMPVLESRFPIHEDILLYKLYKREFDKVLGNKVVYISSRIRSGVVPGVGKDIHTNRVVRASVSTLDGYGMVLRGQVRSKGEQLSEDEVVKWARGDMRLGTLPFLWMSEFNGICRGKSNGGPRSRRCYPSAREWSRIGGIIRRINGA